MTRPPQTLEPRVSTEPCAPNASAAPLLRIRSRDLFKHAREVEIEHDGRIYRLRLTQSNKLILNA